MSRIHRIVMAALVIALGAGGASAFAKGKKHQGGGSALTTNTTAVAVTGQAEGKKHHKHQPHGIVTAVSSGSITLEKGKKHKSKTYAVSPAVTVEKKGHGKKHGGATAGTATGTKHGRKGGKQHDQGALSKVQVGDHVRLTLSGQEVTNILDKGSASKHSKHGKKGAAPTPTI